MPDKLEKLCEKIAFFSKEQFIADMQRTFVLLTQDGKLPAVKVLSEIIGIAPKMPEELVQKEYADYFRNGFLAAFRLLKEVSGITPNLPRELVQKKYDEYIGSKNTSSIPEWERLTGVKCDYHPVHHP